MIRQLKNYFEERRIQKLFAEQEEQIKAAKLKQFDEIKLYIMQEMASVAAPTAENRQEMAFVEPWLYELYELVLLPWQRYEDVNAAHKGYENLLYKSRPVTPEVK